MTIYMTDCTNALLSEIADPKSRMKDVSLSYALAMKAETARGDTPDWPRINAAIRERWGRRGMVRVKNAAWREIPG